MRHGVRTKKLGRNHSHRKALLRNLVRSLVIHGRIRTTLPKAKEARRLAERLMAYAQTGTLAARRSVVAILGQKTLTKKLFDDLAPRFAGRVGGSTRILRLGPRPSDGAEMALLEYVVRPEQPSASTKGEKKPKVKSK